MLKGATPTKIPHELSDFGMLPRLDTQKMEYSLFFQDLKKAVAGTALPQEVHWQLQQRRNGGAF